MKKNDVAKKMLAGKGKFESAKYTGLHGTFKDKKGKASLGFSKHKTDVEGQKSYQYEDK